MAVPQPWVEVRLDVAADHDGSVRTRCSDELRDERQTFTHSVDASLNLRALDAKMTTCYPGMRNPNERTSILQRWDSLPLSPWKAKSPHCNIVWATDKSVMLNKLLVIQKKVLRIITNSP